MTTSMGVNAEDFYTFFKEGLNAVASESDEGWAEMSSIFIQLKTNRITFLKGARKFEITFEEELE